MRELLREIYLSWKVYIINIAIIFRAHTSIRFNYHPQTLRIGDSPRHNGRLRHAAIIRVASSADISLLITVSEIQQQQQPPALNPRTALCQIEFVRFARAKRRP